MSTLRVARYTLLISGLIFVLAVGLGAAAIALDPLALGAFAYAIGLWAGIGLALSSLACVMTQLVAMTQRRKGRG